MAGAAAGGRFGQMDRYHRGGERSRKKRQDLPGWRAAPAYHGAMSQPPDQAQAAAPRRGAWSRLLLARALVVLEALGQIFLVTTVARLVALYSAHGPGPPKPHH